MRPAWLACCLLLAACGGDEEFRQSLGVMTIAPQGPITVEVEVEGGGLDDPEDVLVTLSNEGPGSIDVQTTSVVYLDGEQDWSLIQGFESDLRRGQEAELVVRYSPEFASEARAALIVVIDGEFSNEAWDGDTAEIVLEGVAVDAD